MNISLTWVPFKGFLDDDIEVFFGDDRNLVYERLSLRYGEPCSIGQFREDNYADSKIRLRFDSKNNLQDIEIMGGQLKYDRLELFDTTFSKLQEDLYLLYGKETQWNSTMNWAECPELGISYASQFHMGGDEDEDEIAWVSGSVKINYSFKKSS